MATSTTTKRTKTARAKTVSQRVDDHESQTRYNGTVKLVFDPVKHRYWINGEYANGVTTALSIIDKPQLVYWAANMASTYLKENLEPGVAYDEIQIQGFVEGAKKAHTKRRDGAADMGTYVHNWIEAFVKGENPEQPVSEKLKKVLENFVEFWKDNDIEVLSAERMLCSPSLMLAGTPDLVCRVNGKLTIMDWKTGKGIYPNYFLQLAAYALMLEEEYPDQKVEQLCVVNASIENIFQYEYRDELDKFKETYLKAYELYKAHKEVESLFNKGGKYGNN